MDCVHPGPPIALRPSDEARSLARADGRLRRAPGEEGKDRRFRSHPVLGRRSGKQPPVHRASQMIAGCANIRGTW